MTKRTKIGLSLLGLTLLAIAAFVGGGLYAMAIEDHYGDNQNVFFKCRQGDIVVNRDTKEIRTIERNWTRIYAVLNSDTTDLWLWLHEDRIAIYRSRIDGLTENGVRYQDIENLAKAGDIELIITNR